jgi:hypothetical protein
MTKQEFKKLERICKDGWTFLSRTGSMLKPDRFFRDYECECPACHIASLASDGNDFTGKDCRLCPVTKWNKIANELSNYSDNAGQILEAVCQNKGEAFHSWILAKNIKQRKAWAKEISLLSWCWTDEYADITIPAELLEGRS